ncbi:hypothetical protein [Rhizobium laguerreae]|uniref:hypothetical protein n=1 Tax=Rhizobium laguerreae TaxID=1076926 RepID=UPI002484A06F|nr:hypothetical protein [Rhizobium laguerreae]
MILAVFYPQGNLAPGWLLLSAVAALGAYLVANRLPRMLDAGRPGMPFTMAVRKNLSFWPYAAAGAISWYSFHRAGIHPALGLLPIIPTIPHSDIEFGLLAEIEKLQTDLLNVIEHALKGSVQIVLFLFGLRQCRRRILSDWRAHPARCICFDDRQASRYRAAGLGCRASVWIRPAIGDEL